MKIYCIMTIFSNFGQNQIMINIRIIFTSVDCQTAFSEPTDSSISPGGAHVEALGFDAYHYPSDPALGKAGGWTLCNLKVCEIVNNREILRHAQMKHVKQQTPFYANVLLI